MKCSKCSLEIMPKEYTDLYRIENHHLHPSFMDNPKGLGELIPLCRDCHILKLHPLITEIIIKYSNLLNRKNKNYSWIWKYHVSHTNKEKCIKEVIKFTSNWIKEENKNGINSKKII